MLANNYSNLYQTAFYKQKVEFFKSNNDPQGLENFEAMFSLANTLYTESKNCIGITNVDPKEAAMMVIRYSAIIMTILSSDKSIFEILRDAEDIEEIVKPSKKLTYMQAAIRVCKEHLEKIKNNDSKKPSVKLNH